MKTLLRNFSRFKEQPEYGWVIVGTFLLSSMVILGVRLSFGVFFKSIEADFALNRAATSAVFSVYMAFGCVFALIGGWALERYGPRKLLFLMGLFTGLALLLTSRAGAHWQLFLAFSLPLAVGGGAVFTVSTSTISRWFDKGRALALGIAMSGASLGAVVMSPLAAFLIVSFDWRQAYIIIGLMALLIVLPLSALAFTRKESTESLKAGALAGKVSDRPIAELLRTRNFWMIFFNFFLFGICMFMVYTHLVPHATDTGIAEEKAATIMSLLGFTSIAGRIIMGFIADRKGRKQTAVFSMLLQAIAILWLIWAQSLWAFYLFALVFGFGQGGVAPGASALVGDTFGLRRIGVIIAMLDVGFGIGAALGPFAAGFIYDVSHSYEVAFAIGAVASVAGALAIGLVKPQR